MPSDTHRHDHSEKTQTDGDACCGSANSCGDIAPSAVAPSSGRSFQVSGLDCAEEVSILNKVVGPKVGGAEHLAFDVINGRMTVLDSAKAISDAHVAELVASTGMTAKPWDAERHQSIRLHTLPAKGCSRSSVGAFGPQVSSGMWLRPAWAGLSGSFPAMGKCRCR